jgi:ribosomal protein S18 acetylase RimI-like enzyme
MTTVRKATKADLDAISAIENEPPTVGDTYGDELLRLMLPVTYVAVDDGGTTLGFVTAQALTTSARVRESRGFKYPTRAPRPGAKLKETLVVVNIKVKAAHRGRGVGKQLVRAVLRQTRHKFVVYATPHVGTHVVARCLSAQEYERLPVSENTRRTYEDGSAVLEFAFERRG